MTTIVKNEPDKNQYTLWVDGHKAGSIEYKLGKSRITFIRTEIDSHYRNAGLGSVLVRNALDDVRVNSDRSLVPRCAFTAKWINKHPEYQELVNRTK